MVLLNSYIPILETLVNQGPLFAVLVAVILYLIYKEKQYEKRIDEKDKKIEEKEKANAESDKETRQVLGVVSNSLTSIIENIERQNTFTASELIRTREEVNEVVERQEELFKSEISRLKEFIDLKLK